MIYWVPALILLSIVATLGSRMPRVAAHAALAAGIVAIGDAIVFLAAFAAAPRDSDCVTWDSFVYEQRSVFFVIGAAASIVSAGAGLAAALKRERPARSLIVGAGGAVAGLACFFLVLAIGICGD
jgi:hypothetical protein